MWHKTYAVFVSTGIFLSCFGFEKLTILTQSPVASGGWVGHPAVNSSILRGLAALGVNHNFNPRTLAEIGDAVFVPAGQVALQTAISLKQQGKIRVLLTGPNVVARMTELNSIVAHPAVDRFVANCEWTKIFCEGSEPKLHNRVVIWPAGVDCKYWKPTGNTSMSKQVLVYKKNVDEYFCQEVEHTLRRYGWQPMRITYGEYGTDGFKNMLNQARFAVFLSRSESQGIALAECWSCNVPTLVWDIQQPLSYLEYSIWPVSAAPYLTNATGQFWQNVTEFEGLLQNIDTILAQTQPRDWVLHNMSDEVCAQKLIDIIHDLETRG